MEAAETFVPKFILCYIVKRDVNRALGGKPEQKDYSFCKIFYQKAEAVAEFERLLEEEIPKEYSVLHVETLCEHTTALYNEQTKDLNILGAVNRWTWSDDMKSHVPSVMQFHAHPFYKHDVRSIAALPQQPVDSVFCQFFGGRENVVIQDVD